MKEVDKALDDLIDKAYARYLREMRRGIPGLRDNCGDDGGCVCVDCRRDPEEPREKEEEVKEDG